MLSSGQNLAQAFNTTANGLDQRAIRCRRPGDADRVPDQHADPADCAAQRAGLATHPAGKDGGTVQDQRDELVQQLSTLTGISVTQSSDGETITTGNGTPLVMGSQSFTLQTTTGSDGMQHVLDSNGNDITSSIQGGQLGGAIQVRDSGHPGIPQRS